MQITLPPLDVPVFNLIMKGVSMLTVAEGGPLFNSLEQFARQQVEAAEASAAAQAAPAAAPV